MLTTPTASMLGVEDRTDPEQSIHGGAEYLVYVGNKIPERIAEREFPAGHKTRQESMRKRSVHAGT